MRFELVSPPDRPEENEREPRKETAMSGRPPAPDKEAVAEPMAERVASLDDRITSFAHSMSTVLGRLDESIARYERERPEHRDVEQAPPPDNFRADLFSGGVQR